MSRSPRWRKRRRPERQAAAKSRATWVAVMLPCGHRTALDVMAHAKRAHGWVQR